MQRSRTLPPTRARAEGGENSRRQLGFSEWAGPTIPFAAPLARSAAPEETFLVSNSLLESKSRGIKFRYSPDHEDRCKTKMAPFTSLVKGVRYNADWVQVNKHFLPMRVDGQTVLLCQHDEEDAEGDDGPNEEDVKPMLANHLKNKRLKQLATLEEAKERDRLLSQRRDMFAEEMAHRGFPPREKTTIRPRQLVRPPGPGVFYSVVCDTLEVQSEPGESGAGVPYRAKKKDARVELFDWDETRQWRLIFDDLGWNKSSVPGWVKLDDETQGAPLLRPLGTQMPMREVDKKPLDAVCVAVKEKNLVHLRRFVAEAVGLDARDANLLTPLMLAAKENMVNFCVYLLAGGADAGQLTRGQNKSAASAAEMAEQALGHSGQNQSGASAADFAEQWPPLKAVIDALSGKEYFSMLDFDLAMEDLEKLDPEAAKEAERMLDRIAEQKEAVRRREEEFAAPPLSDAEEEEFSMAEREEQLLREEEEARQAIIRTERELLYKEYEEEQKRLVAESERRRLEELRKEKARLHLTPDLTPQKLPEATPADRGEKLRALREQAARRRAGPEAARTTLSLPKEPENISPAKSLAKSKVASAWICSDCGFETPATRKACDFCDIPRTRDAAMI